MVQNKQQQTDSQDKFSQRVLKIHIYVDDLINNKLKFHNESSAHGKTPKKNFLFVTSKSVCMNVCIQKRFDSISIVTLPRLASEAKRKPR